MADDGFPVYDRGNPEQFQGASNRAVADFLKDPRAPVVEADPSFMDLVASHWYAGTSVGAMIANKAWRTRPSSETLEMDPSAVQARMDDEGVTDPGARDAFFGVRDSETFDAVLGDVKNAQDRRKTMAAFGVGANLVAGLATGLADPVNLVPLGGAVSKVRMAAGGALQTAGRTAVQAGIGAAATEGFIQAVDPMKTAGESVTDIAVGTLFGGLLGFGIHAVVAAPKARQIEARLQSYMDLPEAKLVGDLRKNVETVKAETYTPATPKAREWADVELSKARNAVPEEDVQAPRTGGEPDSVRLAREEAAARLAEDSGPEGTPKPLSSAASPIQARDLNVYTKTDRIDDRLFGVYSPSGMLKTVGKAVPFLRNARVEMQDAVSAVIRDALDKLDINPYITHTDVAGDVKNQVNVHGVHRDLTSKWAAAQEDAEFLWWKNKDQFKSQDEFGKQVYSAVIQGGRSENKIVEQAAKGYRTYFDGVLKTFQDAKVLREDVDLNNAESYAPIVHMIENIRNDSGRFRQVHSEAFNQSIMTDWSKALDRKKSNDAQKAIAGTESKAKLDETVTKIKDEYGPIDGRGQGKLADARRKLIAERDKGEANIKDGFEQKEAELKGRLQEQQIERFRYDQDLGKLREQRKTDLAQHKTDFDEKLRTRLKELNDERKQKIGDAEKKHEDFLAKFDDKLPEWDRTLIRRLTQDSTKARENAKTWADDLAQKYYDGATKNAVINGHDVIDQPGLANVLKARKSKLWQQTAADNGWIETNIFRLSEAYNRRAGMDAAIATVFKKIDKETGELVGDINLTQTKADAIKHYNELIGIVSKRGDAEAETRLVAERNRQLENLDTLLGMLRGRSGDHALSGNMKAIADGAMMFNAWRLMGGTVASSLADPINLVVANGFKDAFRHGIVPAFQNFRSAMLKVPRDELPDMYRINRLMGVVIEHQQNSRLGAMADITAGVPSNKGQAWMQRLNKTFWDFSGITYWSTFWKNAAAGVTHGRLMMAANEGWEAQSAGTKAWLTNLKIGEADLRAMKAMYDAQPEKFSAGVPYAALDQWSDKHVAEIVANALHRESHNVIITPTAGDKLALQATPIGQMVWQFRTYGVTASARLMARNAQLGKLDNGSRANLYTGLFMLALGGAMVDGVKTTLGDVTLAGDSKDGKDGAFGKFIEKWQKTPGESLYNALDRTGTFWLLTEPSNVAQKIGLPNIQGLMSLAAGDEKDAKSGSSRFAQRSVADVALGPSVSLLEDFAKLAHTTTSAAGYAVGLNPDFEFSRTDFARIRRAVPLQNAIGFQQAWNYGHQHLGTVFDWPDPH